MAIVSISSSNVNSVVNTNLQAKNGWWNVHPSDYLTPRNYIVADNWLTIVDDNAGPGSSGNTYAPTGIPSLFNTTTNQFDFSSLSIGDIFGIRLDINLTTTANNQDVIVRGRWGIGGTIQTIVLDSIDKKDFGSYQISSYTKGPVGSANVRDFPADLQIWSDADLSYTLQMIYIDVNRR